MSLLTDIKAAFRRGDCAAARTLVSRMNLAAKTPREREQVYRLQNAVRRCKVRGVAGFPKGYRKRKGQTVKTTRHIPGYPVGIPTGAYVEWQEARGGRHRVTYRNADYWLDDDAFAPLGRTKRRRRR